MEPGGVHRMIQRVGELEADALLARHAEMARRLFECADATQFGIRLSCALMFHRGHPGYADFAAAMELVPHLRSRECCASLFRRHDAAELLVGLAGESARKAAAVLRSLPPSDELPVVLLAPGRAHIAHVRRPAASALILNSSG